MKADLELSEDENFTVNNGYRTLLTDIVLPKKQKQIISSKPIKKKYNRLFSGDNLSVMEQLLSEGYGGKFNLIYIDPPYLSQSKYKHSIKVAGKKKSKMVDQITYTDKWADMDEYLAMLRPRLTLMKKLLSDNGSIFVHLDWHVSHYVKILLDEIFGMDNFRNEIIWCYYGPSSPASKQFNREHQSIFWYSRSSKKWNFYADAVRIPYSKTTMQKVNSRKNGFKGSVHDFSSGKIPEDWWSDIPLAQRYRHEVANFQTQKPKKLIERIVKAVTKEGDLVGDFFAGSGTSGVVCEVLNRKWIICDKSSLSLKITKSRLSDVIKNPYLIERSESQERDLVHQIETKIVRKNIDKTIDVKLKDFKYRDLKRNNSVKIIKNYKNNSELIDSWAVDWNYQGDVFRAVWDNFNENNSESPMKNSAKLTFKKPFPKQIAVKLVDIFGNESIRTLKTSV